MRAHHFGHEPGTAALEAAASLCITGDTSVAADVVAPVELNSQNESAPAAKTAASRIRSDDWLVRFCVTRWGLLRELRDFGAVRELHVGVPA